MNYPNQKHQVCSEDGSIVFSARCIIATASFGKLTSAWWHPLNTFVEYLSLDRASPRLAMAQWSGLLVKIRQMAYDMTQEFLFPPACFSRMEFKWASWAGDGMAGWDGVCGWPACAGGRDWRRRRRRAGLRLYLTLAWTSSSLKTWVMLTLSFAEVSTKPFSQSTVTMLSVVWDDTCNIRNTLSLCQ